MNRRLEMKNCKSLILGCCLAVLAIPFTGASANLLVNGDFETGDLTGWLVYGNDASANVTIQSPDNGPSAPGTHNAFLNNQAEARALLLKQSTAAGSASEGTVFYSFDLKLDQADVGGVLFVNIFAEVAGGGVIGGSGLMGPFWPWNAWSNFNGSFEAPANTDFLTIQIEAVTGAAMGTNCIAHADNVDLNQGQTATETTSWSTIKQLYR